MRAMMRGNVMRRNGVTRASNDRVILSRRSLTMSEFRVVIVRVITRARECVVCVGLPVFRTRALYNHSRRKDFQRARHIRRH